MRKEQWILLFFLLISNSAFGQVTSGSVTIKLAGGDYSTWAAFWDDIGNLTGNLTCTIDASAFTESTAPATPTESLGGFTLTVQPASFPTTTDATTGARFTCNYTGRFFFNSMEGPGTLLMEGIVIIEGTSEPGDMFDTVAITTDHSWTVRRCVSKGGTRFFTYTDVTLQSLKVYNNIGFDMSGQGITITQASTTNVFANNTIQGSGNFGCRCTDKDVTLENVLCYGSTSNDFQDIGVATNGNNNASSDATCTNANWGGTGANNVPSISDPFNAIGSDDFTITAEGSVGTAGKDLSGTFTDDFFGTTRSNWTIGACEFVSAPTGGQVIKMIMSALPYCLVPGLILSLALTFRRRKAA